MLFLTKEIESRKQIQKSEERHRAILQTATDGFWVVDMQGRLLEVNESYCRMSGYSADELLTMRIPDSEINETADDTAAHCQKVMEAETHISGALQGMGLMLAFGIGTIPAMLLVARLAGMKWLSHRRAIYQVSAILMILMGGYFAVKGFRW